MITPSESGIAFYKDDAQKDLFRNRVTEERIMKKSIAVLLTVIMTVGLTACGSSEANAPAAADNLTEVSASKVLADLGSTQGLPNIPDSEEIFFEDPQTQDLTETVRQVSTILPGKENHDPADIGAHGPADYRNQAMELMRNDVEQGRMADPVEKNNVELSDNVQNGIRRVVLPENPDTGFVRPGATAAQFATQKTEYDNMLTLEAGGQISLVLPEQQAVEKQITGQLSIEDILNEWEQVKKEQEKSLEEKVKKRVKKHTGELFEEYDEAAKEDLLEKLSQAAEAYQEEEAKKDAEADTEEEDPFRGYDAQEETSQALEDTPEEEEAAEAERSEAMIREERPRTSGAQRPQKRPVKKAAQKTGPAEKPAQPLPDRTLTAEEKELFDSYIQSRRTRGQLIHTLEKMSMAACTGNVLVTGERDAGTVDFARNLIKMMRIQDGNFSGKAAKIDGSAMNKKDPEALFDKLKNGALIIDNAGALNCETAEKINRALQNEERGLLLILVDGRKSLDALLQINDFLKETFNTRVDIEALNDKKLVEYGRRYAYEKEYAIDEMGALALHTRIENLQTMDHAVTVGEVRDIIRGAIQHANRKNLAHFCDVLFGRRYDEEDMVVLRENDFLVDM